MASHNVPVRVFKPDFNPNLSVATMLVPDEILNLGKGIRVGVHNSGGGGRVVFEMKSGEAIGINVKTVMEDFLHGKPHFKRDHIEAAIIASAKARLVSIAEFFKR